MRLINIFVAILAFSTVLFNPDSSAASTIGAVIRVAVDGSSSDPLCGETWDHPCDLQYVLQSRASSGDEIWVKAGTYRPASINTAGVGFKLLNDVGMYGGFRGDETERDQRDWVINPVILSGQLDTLRASYVVQSEQSNSSTIFDGFTITEGKTGFGNLYSSPTLRNLIIKDNDCSQSVCGSGMENLFSNPYLENVTFESNVSENGGGMMNYGSSPTLFNVLFKGNSASIGYGGVV